MAAKNRNTPAMIITCMPEMANMCIVPDSTNARRKSFVSALRSPSSNARFIPAATGSWSRPIPSRTDNRSRSGDAYGGSKISVCFVIVRFRVVFVFVFRFRFRVRSCSCSFFVFVRSRSGAESCHSVSFVRICALARHQQAVFSHSPRLYHWLRSRSFSRLQILTASLVALSAPPLYLRRGGTLGTFPNYEERPGQIEISSALTTALNSRSHLMIEAGTGIGKSLAYLVPAILWSWTNETPVVISTATRNLQSQLIDSDIPRALAILGDNAPRFKVALLKGRTNYLCLRAIFDQPLFESLAHLTPDGDLDHPAFADIPRALVSCPGDECTSRKCPFYDQCYVYKARKRAAEAHLIIVNHSLTLAEAATSTGSILPAYGTIIFDEAHNLEDIATDHLSSEFSLPPLNRILKRMLGNFPELAPKASIIHDKAEDFLTFLGHYLPPKTDIRRFDASRSYFKNPDHLHALQLDFEQPLINLVHELHDRADVTDDSEAAMKLEAAANQLLAFANEAAFVVQGDQATHAYWVERVHTEKRKTYIRLVAAPLSVAKALKELFYDVKDSVLLLSATLRVGNDFRYMAKRLGCEERFQMITAESPFDYFRQALVLAPDCLPDPSTNPSEYATELASLLKELFTRTDGRALVLFTSYEMMNAVAQNALLPLTRAGITLLIQGEGCSREAMVRELKTKNRTVLFGAQSFWEGVDVSGEALSCVVLTRLPFAQVGDPIIEARGEKIVREGGSAFRDYALPEAVIKFRQGFGRLVRTKSDRGVVIITDPRIVTKNYGAVFRRSIPATVHTITDLNELLVRVADFFSPQ